MKVIKTKIMQSFYTSPQEIETLVEAFNTKILPKEKWTHAAHLTVALWYLKYYAFDEALVRVTKGITEYNLAVGTQNTATGGYHETMTVFWMTVVYFFVRNNEGQALHGACNVLLAGPLSARELPFHFYERETILSPMARAVYVSPDKALLNDEALENILAGPSATEAE